jgi:hypothetical protein
MIWPMTFVAGLCVAIGLAPLALLPALDRAASALGTTVHLSGLAGLGSLSLVAAIGLLAGAALWDRIRRTPFRRTGTWDCGYQAPTARIQYTGASFAQMLTDSFAWVLRPMERRPRVQGLFPRSAAFRTRTPDIFLEKAVKPSLDFTAWAMSWLRILQAGHLPIYLLYVVLTLVALFVWTLS